jgi:glycosyltransferase involved in cell wall biosynthesis
VKRVALVCLRGAINMASWLGNATAIETGLRARGLEVVRIDVAREQFSLLLKAKQLLMTRVLRRGYSRHREPLLLRHYGREIGREVAASGADVVLALTAMPVAALECRQPIVFWNDAPFGAMLDFYPTFSNMTPRSIELGHAMERSAHERCAMALYSSWWAADFARDHYAVPNRKLGVVDFGANVEVRRDHDQMAAVVHAKSQETVCRLLWMGVDWVRKGGDAAVEIARELHESGTPVELTIAGCRPPARVKLPPYVQALGFVAGADRGNLFERAHFLLLPTLADCSPIVLGEAGAYAVPAVSTRIGGIPEMISDEKTGHVFDLGVPPAELAAWIRGAFGSPARYASLAISAFEEYRNRLNWDVALAKVERYLTEVS